MLRELSDTDSGGSSMVDKLPCAPIIDQTVCADDAAHRGEPRMKLHILR